jgi:hypothetical protein
VTYSIGRVGRLDTATVEEKSDRRGRLSLTLAEGIHELLESSGALDLKEDLVVVVGHLDVKVLANRLLWLLQAW